MKLTEQKDQLEKLIEQHNQTSEQLQMLQSTLADYRLQISKQQGIVEALQSVEKGNKDAKT
jgi:prefoldin subunit 5|tara:strand:+ start:754 stop:936 length:183 start_codon:yes stop_codon:yes gene_type:complete